MAQEGDELQEEVESLRSRVAELSEAVADCRARRLQQQSTIARLRELLREQEPPAQIQQTEA